MDLVLKFGSQITVFLGLIIYFIKRHFDYKSKLIEIKQSLHQDLRLSSINKFIESYTALESFYWQVSFYDVIERKIQPKDLDDLQLPFYNAFIASYYSLFLILNEDEIKDFDKIKDEIITVRDVLGHLYDYFEEETNTQKANKYVAAYTKMMRNNEKMIRLIGIHVRNTYIA
jgi:hypothetical protein